MRPLRGQLLLEAWERGAAGSALTRPLALLEAASPGLRGEDWPDLSMAERDQNLFRLRQITFGDGLRGVLPCEACSTRMEFEISVDSILHRGELRHEAVWSSGAFTFVLRAVTTRDLAEAVAAPDPRRRLLELCMIVDGVETPKAVADHEEAAVAEFNRLNAGAETRFTLPCPACREVTHADQDIGKFLW